jgi:hypothetical protein
VSEWIARRRHTSRAFLIRIETECPEAAQCGSNSTSKNSLLSGNSTDVSVSVSFHDPCEFVWRVLRRAGLAKEQRSQDLAVAHHSAEAANRRPQSLRIANALLSSPRRRRLLILGGRRLCISDARGHTKSNLRSRMLHSGVVPSVPAARASVAADDRAALYASVEAFCASSSADSARVVSVIDPTPSR